MTQTILAGAIALALNLSSTTPQKHEEHCPAGKTVRKVVLVPLVEKPAYSKDPRQYIYVRRVKDVPIKGERCVCGKDKSAQLSVVKVQGKDPD